MCLTNRHQTWHNAELPSVNMGLIFADLGDGSGKNVSTSNCNKWEVLIFKLLNRTGYPISVQLHKTKVKPQK